MRSLAIAVRRLNRSRSFLAVAVITIALAVGFSATLISFLLKLTLQTQPGVADGKSLIQLTATSADGTGNYPSIETFLTVDAEPLSAMTVAAYEPQFVTATLGDRPLRLFAHAVSSRYFEAVRPSMVTGRGIIPADFAKDGEVYPIVISRRLWVEELGSDAAILGRRMTVNGKSVYTVVGVAGRGFHGPEGLVQADLWAPRTSPLRMMSLTRVIGRVRDGVDRRTAAAELLSRWRRTEMAARGSTQDSASARATDRPSLQVHPLRAGLHHEQRATVVSLFQRAFVVSGMLLVLTCLNLAGLAYARVLTRRREISTRRALGASNGAVVREVVMEFSLVFLLGTLLSLLVARLSAQLLIGALAHPFPLMLSFSPDVLTLVALLALAGTALLLTAAVPAWHAAGVDPAGALRADAVASSASRGVRRTQNTILGLQIAATCVLVACTASIVGSMASRLQLRIGVPHAKELLVVSAPEPLRSQSADARKGAVHQLAMRLRAHPGVADVAIGYQSPGLARLVRKNAWIQSGTVADSTYVAINLVSRGFLEIIAPVTAGRALPDADTGAARVAVASRALAQRLFPVGTVLGQRLVLHDSIARGVEIIGIAPDVLYDVEDQPTEGVLYVPAAQWEIWGIASTVVARTRGDASAMRLSIDSVVRGSAGDMPAARSRTVPELVATQTAAPRNLVALFGVVSALTILLSIVGLFGMLAHGINERRREIGVRRALGASEAGIVALFASGTMGLTIAALAVGGATTFLVLRRLPEAWTTTGATVPVAMASGIAIVVSLIVTVFAVRRLATAAPAEVLRQE